MQDKIVLSPSSINLFKQCPRKFFYQYIKRLPTKPSIHLLRGSIVHKTLEEFFLDPGIETKHLEKSLFSLFEKNWKSNETKLKELNLTNAETNYYHQETEFMLFNWLTMFIVKLEKLMKKQSYAEAFKNLTPKTEEKYYSEELGVIGYIDAIEDVENEIRLMDYKTSAKDLITEEYKTQLAIYALLYDEKHKIPPDKVGIYFLKHGERLIDVNKGLLDYAKEQILYVRSKINSTEITNYTKNITPLCKWSTGKCDFYDVCVNEK